MSFASDDDEIARTQAAAILLACDLSSVTSGSHAVNGQDGLYVENMMAVNKEEELKDHAVRSTPSFYTQEGA